MKQRQAFIEQIQAHQGLINKIVFLYADTPTDRDDLRQDILAAAWQAYGRFRGEAQFSTWLYRVGLNVAISSLRKRKKRPEVRPEELPEASTAPARSEDLVELILHLLQPVEKSMVLLLIEGFEQAEIAEMLGITPNHLRVKLHRLRAKLKKHGIETLAGTSKLG